MSPTQRIAPDTAVLSGTSPEEIARVVAAFLNTEGGRVLLGIAEDGTVIGVDDHLISHRLQDTLRSGISPAARFSVIVRNVGDKHIVLVDVPAGAERPYVVNDRIFVWRGAEVAAAGALDISQMIAARGEVSSRWERQPALGIDISDLDDREIDLTRVAYRDRSIRGSRKSTGLAEFLAELNVVTSGQVLNSAAILFANDDVALPQSRVRIAAFETAERSEFRENRFLQGNLFSIFEQIAAFLDRHLPSSSTFTDFRRHDQIAIPPFVVREGVMNALVHRDYSQVQANTTVALHPDRLEIWNPGHLPEGISPETLARTRVSRPPNPDIAHVAFLRGLVEQWGSGTGRIVDECRKAGLGPPKWESVAGGVRLTVFTAPGEAHDDSLNERSRVFLRDTFPGQMITLRDFQSRWGAGLSHRTSRRDIDELVEAGYLLVRQEHPLLLERTDKPLSW